MTAGYFSGYAVKDCNKLTFDGFATTATSPSAEVAIS